MNREELLRSEGYWLANVQSNIYDLMEEHRVNHKLKKKDLAEILGVTRGYVSQIMNGDFDHKISKLVNLALAFGKVPCINFLDLEQFIKDDKDGKTFLQNRHMRPIQNILNIDTNSIAFSKIPFEAGSTAMIPTVTTYSSQ